MSFSDLHSVADAVRTCQECPLGRLRTQAVPGYGGAASGVMLIGEAPGQNEDKQGRPFVGRAGDLLNRGLLAAGWRRQDVYVTNTVKCRPPGNRDPLPEEVSSCAKYLLAEKAILRPRMIILLGRHALASVRPDWRISEVHGQVWHDDGQMYFASYHPAAALYSPALVDTFINDLVAAKAILDMLDYCAQD